MAADETGAANARHVLPVEQPDKGHPPDRPRNVLVTGGSGGLGAAISRRFASGGDRVFVTYYENQVAADALVKELVLDGGQAQGVHVNLAEPESITSALNEVLSACGVIDVLINNAGARPIGSFLELTDQNWEDVWAVDLMGAVRCSRRTIPGMLDQGWGRIINMSGLDAYWGWGNRSHVTVAKNGLIGLTRALAVEYSADGITTNTIVPGSFATPRRTEWYPEWEQMRSHLVSVTPVGRQGRPSELADTCWFLASDGAAYITGQEIHINGGSFPLSRNPTF
jgi:NAD(P)-dependent dehydrogenase (short-subunit alcohol dehydrogenase family)